MELEHFQAEAGRAQIRDLVRSIERRTAAEVVIAVRPTSGHYRHVDLYVGMATASVALGVFLFHPEPFDVRIFPVELVAAFLLGAVLCANISAVRRALCLPRLLDENVKRAARAAFVELGVSRTRQRGGVLVFVSLFERRVEVVADIGVDEKGLGPEYRDAVRALEVSVAQDGPYDAFVKALGRLAAPLENALPRAADDVNELADDVHERTA